MKIRLLSTLSILNLSEPRHLKEHAKNGDLTGVKAFLHKLSANYFFFILGIVLSGNTQLHRECVEKLLQTVEIDPESVFSNGWLYFLRVLSHKTPDFSEKMIAMHAFEKLPMQKLHDEVWKYFLLCDNSEWLSFLACEMKLKLDFNSECQKIIRDTVLPTGLNVLLDAGMDPRPYSNRETVKRLLCERSKRARSAALCLWWCWKIRYGKDIATILAKQVWESWWEQCWDEPKSAKRQKIEK